MTALFGPVFTYDLLRLARRGRLVLLRVMYALVLFGLLYLTYHGHVISFRDGWASPKDLAAFAERFFWIFLVAQFAAVLVVTPALVGDALADERHRGTLAYLFTTHLTDREIVLGKLGSRLAAVFALVLTGLPILSLAQLFGGVSPELLWAGFAATAGTLISVAALSLCLSVFAKRPRDAIVQAYLILIAYLLFGLMAQRVAGTFSNADLLTSLPGAAAQIVAAGHPLTVFDQLQAGLRQGLSYADLLLPVLAPYALFHGVLTAVLLVRAAQRLRAAEAAVQVAVAPARKAARRPQVPADGPMFWKEWHVETAFRLGRVGWVVVAVLVLAVLVPLVLTIVEQVRNPNPYVRYPYGNTWGYQSPSRGWFAPLGSLAYPYLGDALNGYIAGYGTLLACLALLGVGVRAAGAVGGERDRQTLDGLLAAPLTAGEILRAKWAASWLTLLRLLAIPGAIWVVGLLTGGLDVGAALFLAVLLAAYAAFLASLGLLFSVTAKTTLRAVLSTVTVAVLLGGGPWLCLMAIDTGNWAWSVPVILIMMGGLAAFLASPLAAASLWVRTQFRGLRGLYVSVVLLLLGPVAALYILLGVLGNGSNIDLLNSLGRMLRCLAPPLLLRAAVVRYPGWNEDLFRDWMALPFGLGPFVALAVLLGWLAHRQFRRRCGRVEDAPADPRPAKVRTPV